MIFLENYSSSNNGMQPSKDDAASSDLQEKRNGFVDTLSAVNLIPEVFTDVRATLAAHIGSLLAGNLEVFMTRHSLKLKLHQEEQNGEMDYTVSGKLKDIISAHVLLQSMYLQSCEYSDLACTEDNEQISHKISVPNISVKGTASELSQDLESSADVELSSLEKGDVINTATSCMNDSSILQSTELTLSCNDMHEGPEIEEQEERGVLHKVISETLTASHEEIQVGAQTKAKIMLESNSPAKNAEEEEDGFLRRSKRLRRKRICSKSKKTRLMTKIMKNVDQSETHVENSVRLPSGEAVLDGNAEDGDEACDILNKGKRRSAINWRLYDDRMPFKYFCDLCSFKTKRRSHLEKHKLLHNKVDTILKCDQCPFMTLQLGHLRRHAVSHSNTLLHCDECAYKTDSQKLLLRHIRVKHGNDEQPQPAEGDEHKLYTCKDCTFQSTRQHLFVRHARIHQKKTEPRKILYQCEKCDYKTGRKVHFVRHCNNVHSERRPYLCHTCGKAFKRADALRQHMVAHGGGSEDGVSACPECHKVFKSRSYMCQHRAVHTNVRMFLCEVCGASFKTRAVQRKHIQSIHKNPRAYLCTLCRRGFNTQFALRRHIKTHKSATMEPTPNDPETNAVNNSVVLTEEHVEGQNMVITVEGNCSVTQTVPVLSATSVMTNFSSKQIPISADITSVTHNCISTSDLIQQFPTTVLYLANNVPT